MKTEQEILKEELQKQNFKGVYVEETSQARPTRFINGSYVVISAMKANSQQYIDEIKTLKEENERLKADLKSFVQAGTDAQKRVGELESDLLKAGRIIQIYNQADNKGGYPTSILTEEEMKEIESLKVDTVKPEQTEDKAGITSTGQGDRPSKPQYPPSFISACDYCNGSGYDPYPNHDTTMRPCLECDLKVGEVEQTKKTEEVKQPETASNYGLDHPLI